MIKIFTKQKAPNASFIIDITKLKSLRGLLGCLLFFTPMFSIAQLRISDSLLREVTLQAAIDYAIKRQPRIRQALLDEEITASNIRSKLADWYS